MEWSCVFGYHGTSRGRYHPDSFRVHCNAASADYDSPPPLLRCNFLIPARKSKPTAQSTWGWRSWALLLCLPGSQLRGKRVIWHKEALLAASQSGTCSHRKVCLLTLWTQSAHLAPSTRLEQVLSIPSLPCLSPWTLSGQPLPTPTPLPRLESRRTNSGTLNFTA